MAASTEAQRLVAISLGKIAESRAKRTGINLHKSLLVSTVLFKARTTVIREKYYVPSTDSQIAETSSEESDFESEETETECEESSAPADEKVQNSDDRVSNNSDIEDQENAEVVDKENVSSQDSSAPTPVRECRNTSVLGSCENTTQNLDNKEITKCERCTKRRLSDVESCENFTSPSKKSKSENDYVVDTSSQDSNNTEEPMDQTQITHLVDSFSSGFTGLLTTGNTCLSQGQNHTTSLAKGQGLSEAFNHCSTQIKESFDTLSTPVIALTV